MALYEWRPATEADIGRNDVVFDSAPIECDAYCRDELETKRRMEAECGGSWCYLTTIASRDGKQKFFDGDNAAWSFAYVPAYPSTAECEVCGGTGEADSGAPRPCGGFYTVPCECLDTKKSEVQ